MTGATANFMLLTAALVSVVVSTASVAAEGASPAVNADALVEVVRLAAGGDPVAYGRLWAYSNRCKIEPELAGVAVGRVASSAMRTGQANSLEDFIAKAQPGLRQGNRLSKAAIDCVATQEGFLGLAGVERKSAPVHNVNDAHTTVISRNSCAFKAEDPAAIMMTAYLNEKNGIDDLGLSRERNIRRTRLADTFIAPQYFDRYRLVPGTAEPDLRGSRPERLLCVKARRGVLLGITAITNRENGWTTVMEYQLIDEKGRIFILPTRPPVAAFAMPYKYGNDPTTSITPMSVVDGYPDTKE